jgi:hypothetical protein
VITLLRRLWRHLRPSPVGVAQDEALLAALASDIADPDGYDRMVFLASNGPKAGA